MPWLQAQPPLPANCGENLVQPPSARCAAYLCSKAAYLYSNAAYLYSNAAYLYSNVAYLYSNAAYLYSLCSLPISHLAF